MPRPAETPTPSPPLTLTRLLRAAAADLRRAGIEDAASDARLLLGRATGRSREELVGDGEVVPRAAELAVFAALLERRLAREPMAYILGGREFWGLDFAVEPGVLTPRPETETLIEAALAIFPDRAAPLRILDLGVGSGCLLVTLLHLYPEARGIGTDRAPVALRVTRANARRFGVAGRARLRRTSWAEDVAGPFDLIVSNPPYVATAEMAGLAPEVAVHEPPLALLGGPDGLDAYRRIAPAAARLLAPAGTLLLEIGLGQTEAVGAILAAAGLSLRRRIADLAGTPRCLVALRG